MHNTMIRSSSNQTAPPSSQLVSTQPSPTVPPPSSSPSSSNSTTPRPSKSPQLATPILPPPSLRPSPSQPSALSSSSQQTMSLNSNQNHHNGHLLQQMVQNMDHAHNKLKKMIQDIHGLIESSRGLENKKLMAENRIKELYAELDQEKSKISQFEKEHKEMQLKIDASLRQIAGRNEIVKKLLEEPVIVASTASETTEQKSLIPGNQQKQPSKQIEIINADDDDGDDDDDDDLNSQLHPSPIPNRKRTTRNKNINLDNNNNITTPNKKPKVSSSGSSSGSSSSSSTNMNPSILSSQKKITSHPPSRHTNRDDDDDGDDEEGEEDEENDESDENKENEENDDGASDENNGKLISVPDRFMKMIEIVKEQLNHEWTKAEISDAYIRKHADDFQIWKNVSVAAQNADNDKKRYALWQNYAFGRFAEEAPAMVSKKYPTLEMETGYNNKNRVYFLIKQKTDNDHMEQ